jgi:hypothetical protein
MGLTDPPPDIRELDNSLISDQDKSGVTPTGMVPTITESVIENVVKKEEIKPAEMAPSREPEFPGGQQAWLNFLRKNLIAPSELEPGEKKTVSIRFFVSTDGSIANFEVVQSA